MRKVTIWLGVTVIILFIAGFLEYRGIVWHNSIFAMKYPVKGLDVSHHQGKIDWEKIAEKNKYKFVFIKATEGQDFIDKDFKYNWDEARRLGILAGAYHFFSMQSSGEKQAQNFIDIVPKENDSLPPVIDIEISLNHEKEKVRRELRNMINKLEEHYQVKPILYVTYDTYGTYTKGYFDELKIWIRDVIKYPTLGQSWLFWQYTNRGRVPGVDTYIDINVFNSDMETLKSYLTIYKLGGERGS